MGSPSSSTSVAARSACPVSGPIRHSIAIRLADKGYDLATIGAILGHKPPYRATLIYTQHTSERRQRLALEQVFQQKSQRPSPDS
jgi:site-specific recombinase XerD